MGKCISLKWKQKETRSNYTCISKIFFSMRMATKDKDIHIYNDKRINLTRGITFANVYTPHTGAPKQKANSNRPEQRQIVIQSYQGLNTHFKQRIDHLDRKPTWKHQSLAILEEKYLIDIYRTFYLNTSEYPFFSSTHGTFLRIDHKLVHKSQ